MKPDRRIYHKISINFLKCFQKLHGTEWNCWTPKKGQNIYLMEVTGSRMNFPIPKLHPFRTKHLRNINIEPSDPTQPFTKDSAQIQSYEKTCFTDKWIFWHDSQASLAASNGWVIKMRHARNDNVASPTTNDTGPTTPKTQKLWDCACLQNAAVGRKYNAIKR